MPIGIIGSLFACTVLYMAVSAVLTGVAPYTELNTAEPVTYALRKINCNFGSAIVGVGRHCGADHGLPSDDLRADACLLCHGP